MEKSELKKLVKEAIDKEMERNIRKASENMTKLRFIKNYELNRKEYVNRLSGHACILALKTRLNMLPVYSNFKGDLNKDKICVHCKVEEDNTEHLLECIQLGETLLTRNDLNDDRNPELWKLINERVQYNLDTRGTRKVNFKKI